MKRILKVLSIVLMSVMVLSLFIACANDNNNVDTGADVTANDETEPADVDGEEAVEPDEPIEEPIDDDEPAVNGDDDGQITLRVLYPPWGLGEADADVPSQARQLFAAFEDAHPHITLELLEIPPNADGSGGDYHEFMHALAAQGELPDVFVQWMVSEQVERGWAYDITDIALADADYMAVVAEIREDGKINGRVFGLPAGMNLFGMFLNLDIYEELNVEPLPFNYTMDDLRMAIAATTTDTYRGIGGFRVQDWGPFVLNTDLGWTSFDGERFHMSGPEFAQSIAFAQDVVARGHSGADNIIAPEEWLPEGAQWPWWDGFIANQFEATWMLPAVLRGETGIVNGDLWPLPNETIIIIPDYMFVSATTNHPQEAFDLIKWFNFGTDGMHALLDIIDRNEGFSFGGLPLSPGHIPALDEFFLGQYGDRMPMFRQVYEYLSTGRGNILVEPFKGAPGFAAVFSLDTGVIGVVDGYETSLNMTQLIDSIIMGDRQLADYAAEMERLANAEIDRANEALADIGR